MKVITNKKQLIFIIIIASVILFGTYLIGTGFVKRSDVSLFDYKVSEDGTELTMEVHAMSSAGYIRGFKEFNHRNPNILVFYSTFGGFNSTLGAKDTFTLKLSPDMTELYFYKANNNSVDLVLRKEEKTGQWKRPNDIVDIVEEVNYIQEIENPNWGITFEVDEISPTGLYVLCTQSGGAPTGELHTGSRFVVEKWTEKNGWQEPDWIPQKYPVAWTDEAWGIPKDKTIVWYIDWDIVYGKLPAGKYRIGKKVTDFRDTGDYDIAMIYAEFEIKE